MDDIVRFLAATLLAADQAIFGDFPDWLQNLLGQRGGAAAGISALGSVRHLTQPDGCYTVATVRLLLVGGCHELS